MIKMPRKIINTILLVIYFASGAHAAARSAALDAGSQPITLNLIQSVNSFSGSGLFSNLQGLWLDKQKDYFYVLEDAPSVVYQFDRSGRSLKYFNLDANLKDVTYLGRGTRGTYLKSEGRILLFNPDFTESEEIKFHFVPPANPDAATEPVPLEFNAVFPEERKNVIYGYDPNKKIVYQCDEDASCKVFIRTFMKYGSDVMTGQVRGVYNDKWGRFHLVDDRGRQVWKFGADGRFISGSVKQIDFTRDKFYQPELVAVDNNKRSFIYDAAIRKIKVYDDFGIFKAEINIIAPEGPLFLLPAAMEFDDLGRLYVLDRGDMTIKIFEVKDAGF